ncbi:hypothetical protein Q4S45_21425 [Massilia sp. R2A-15]|uniref:hypothetical protein n=1 Tax=Massilia sp. R2A-15 TaxID=3064278 RepID=UPI0027372756|nr:hypothetical protein [Massilia sp. R2A-15]WLI89225.1 hypothetical protein Q4S45_21425 [Massilia sp. R2A-15]
MDGLQRLRKWFGVEEAAQILTNATGRPVHVADVIRCALDGHLKLSLRLITPTKARAGFRLPSEEESLTFIAECAEETQDLEVEFRVFRGAECITLSSPASGQVASEFSPADDDCEETIGLVVETDVICLVDVVDLILRSDGRRMVDAIYQALVGHQPASHAFDKGIYVEGRGRKVFQLLQPFDEVVFKERQIARSASLRDYIEDNNFSADQAIEYLAAEERYRHAYLQHETKTLTLRKYMPASDFPLDSNLVVRGEYLASFVANLTRNVITSAANGMNAVPALSIPSCGAVEQGHLGIAAADAPVGSGEAASLSASATRPDAILTAEATIKPPDDCSEHSGPTPAGLTRREKQLRFIENTVNSLGYAPMKIPKGGKGKIRQKCKAEAPELFGAGVYPFNEAWQQAVKQRRVRMADHDKYSSGR